ncbi:hypothetical protein [Lichenicoccus sp.]|uniref:hypothetical protein n=1 Tax=Lichenicoccus sp. TaxID=2781899 RepID=UPI003D1003FD
MIRATRPFFWSIRRELWENRSITVAPLAASATVLLGFLVGASHLARDMRRVLALDASRQGAELAKSYEIASVVVIVTTLLVGFMYCLGALHGERRDRSILFWKSLPVSDRTTVLAKAVIPLAVLPLLAVATVVVLQLVMLLLSTAILLADGVSATPLWTKLPLPRMDLELLYGLATLALWYAPIHLWLLLVSGWARRAAFLWAVLPPLALCVLEKIAFGSTKVFAALIHRLTGSVAAAFTEPPGGDGPAGLSQLDPLKFLGTPGLWTGLALSAAFLAAAIWLRRHRDPI